MDVSETPLNALGVGAVMIGSLPATLFSEQAPSKYVVEAVFTRRPEPGEIDGIHGDATTVFLADRGYAGVRLSVADRRLRIEETTLEELRDGLAAVIAERLAAVSARVQLHHRESAARAEKQREFERDRETAVRELAESVVFLPTVSPTDLLATEIDSDARSVTGWVDEGGSTG
ncbi:hypothetical protein [Leucobacter sp. GX24907]